MLRTTTIRLGQIALARSGDKGASANVGVIARSPEAYACLVEALSATKVAEFFRPLGVLRVARYELPGLGALNFVLEGILAGGGSTSLRMDAQGKILGQLLLEIKLEVGIEVASRCKL